MQLLKSRSGIAARARSSSCSSCSALHQRGQPLQQRRRAAVIAAAATVEQVPSNAAASSSPRAQSQPQQQQPQQQQPASAMPLPPEIKAVLFSEEEIRATVQRLAQQICADFADEPNLALVGVLNGAFIFTSDLAREVARQRPDLKVDFLRASSYGDAAESTGTVRVQKTSDLSKWRGYACLLVEDIIDSGHTLARLGGLLEAAGATRVKYVALLDKKGRRRVECWPDYVGHVCPDEFVVGYGLDYDEAYRCLPYVAALREEAYGGASTTSSTDGNDGADAAA